MEVKYARHMRNREINNKTGEVWKINDVPYTWRQKTVTLLDSEGYYIAEDGTAYPIPVNEEN